MHIEWVSYSLPFFTILKNNRGNGYIGEIREKEKQNNGSVSDGKVGSWAANSI